MLLLFGLLTWASGCRYSAVLPVVPFCYHLLFLAARHRATPGQALLGLTVRRDDDLGPPTALQALVFTLVFYAHAGDLRPAAAGGAVHRPPPHAARYGQRTGGGARCGR